MTTPALQNLAGYLIKAGYSPNAVSGIIANAHHESDGDPEAVGDGGTSFGLFQWHDDRAKNLVNFARRQDADPRSAEVQYGFLQHELDNNAELKLALNAAPSAERAAEIFTRRFERPKDVDNEARSRAVTAAGVVKWINHAFPEAKAPQFTNFAERAIAERGGNIGPSEGDVQPAVFPNALGSAPALGALASRLGAFERAGVEPTLAAISPSMAGRTITNIAKTLPFGETTIANPIRQATAQAGSALSRAAQGLGMGGTIEETGQIVQKGIDAFRGRFTTEASRLYQKVGDYFPKEMPVKLNNTASNLEEMGKTFASNPEMEKIVTPGLYDRIRSALSSTDNTLTWQQAQEFRTFLGEKLNNPQLLGDATIGQLKKLYGAVSNDLGAAAKSVGGDASRAWETAQSFWKQGREVIDKHLQSIWKATPAQAYDRILAAAREGGSRADLAKLRTLRDSLDPKELGDVSSTILRELGRPKPGSALALEGQEFSPTTFITEWNKLAPEAKDILFGKIGSETRGPIEDIVTVAQGQKGIEMAGNPSGSGRWALAGGLGAGLVADPISTLLAAGSTLGAGRAMVSPTTARLAAQFPPLTQAVPETIGAAVAPVQNEEGRTSNILAQILMGAAPSGQRAGRYLLDQIVGNAIRQPGQPSLPGGAQPTIAQTLIGNAAVGR